MKKTIGKGLKDIFSKEVIFFVLKIGLLSFVISGAIIWILWGTLTSFIAGYLSWIPWEWLQNTGAGIVNLLLVYIIFIIVASLLTSLMSEKLLKRLALKHYPNISVNGSPNMTTSIILTLKATVVFFLLFVLGLPILFIPILGQVLMLYLWSILINQPTQYDVNSLLSIKNPNKKTTTLAMVASLFNYVPLLNLFTPVFAQILFLHSALSSKS